MSNETYAQSNVASVVNTNIGSLPIDSGKFKFKPELEDVHMNIESALIKKAGPAGARLHTARSRNDQVALDLRLYMRDECDNIDSLLRKLEQALLKQAGESAIKDAAKKALKDLFKIN